VIRRVKRFRVRVSTRKQTTLIGSPWILQPSREMTQNSSAFYTYSPDDGGSKHLWNFGKLVPDYTAQQPKNSHLSYSPPWEPQISLLHLLHSTKDLSRHSTVQNVRNWLSVIKLADLDNYIALDSILLRYIQKTLCSGSRPWRQHILTYR
jgi:hypothetical protein